MTLMTKRGKIIVLIALSTIITSCATSSSRESGFGSSSLNMSYSARLPQSIDSTAKTIVVDPRVHAWGAYENGQLVKAGLASAGADYCRDIHRPCHTRAGTFRIQSLGGPDCVSHTFPLHVGGAPMPYCMFFNNGQALHGVPPHEVGEGNYSHGCVRLHVSDAEWIRYDFANVGTRVVVKPY